MASQAKEILALKTLDVVADKGYYSATEIKNCVDDKIHPIIPPPIIPPIDTQQQQKKTGRYGKDDCVYCCTYTGAQDEYTRPNHKTLAKKATPSLFKGNWVYL